MEIIISDTVRSKAPTLYVETRVIRDVHILSTSPGLEEDKIKVIAHWANVTEQQLASKPLIAAYRELKRQLGGDTQMLPTVEGLLTRGILKGRFPKVNSVVDAANIVSITHLVPIGLFDFDKIRVCSDPGEDSGVGIIGMKELCVAGGLRFLTKMTGLRGT